MLSRLSITVLLALPLSAQADRVLSASDGNFELRGTVRAASSPAAALRFRVKSGLGYRLVLSGPAAGRLDDPGRRTGVLAAPAVKTSAREIAFRLSAVGPRFQLEINGKPAWEYLEKEAGVASAGAVSLTGSVRDLKFAVLPPTPASFAERYGPGIGEKAPLLLAVDQVGKPRDFASLRGPKGLWVLFIRSADW